MAPRDEGSFGTTDPVLWVFERYEDYASAQMSSVQLNNLSPVWPDQICLTSQVSQQPPCFQIRDDYDPHFPKDRPPVLHYGCAESDGWGWGAHSTTLSLGPDAVASTNLPMPNNRARLFFSVKPQMPGPPPSRLRRRCL